MQEKETSLKKQTLSRLKKASQLLDNGKVSLTEFFQSLDPTEIGNQET